ncbi:hypothetical protein PRIPAC_78067, partial [Pristionchus pacificus]|uniref:Uncharacterized protein n=1 Tax=Pristionchus pacificus TaxID=54126 RepID=A0A2A6CQG2_PRIPA
SRNAEKEEEEEEAAAGEVEEEEEEGEEEGEEEVDPVAPRLPHHRHTTVAAELFKTNLFYTVQKYYAVEITQFDFSAGACSDEHEDFDILDALIARNQAARYGNYQCGWYWDWQWRQYRQNCYLARQPTLLQRLFG